MDPNANLEEQRRLAARIQAIWDHCAENGTLTASQQAAICNAANELAERVGALDMWLARGGFLPKRWER